MIDVWVGESNPVRDHNPVTDALRRRVDELVSPEGNQTLGNHLLAGRMQDYLSAFSTDMAIRNTYNRLPSVGQIETDLRKTGQIEVLETLIPDVVMEVLGRRDFRDKHALIVVNFNDPDNRGEVQRRVLFLLNSDLHNKAELDATQVEGESAEMPTIQSDDDVFDWIRNKFSSLLKNEMPPGKYKCYLFTPTDGCGNLTINDLTRGKREKNRKSETVRYQYLALPVAPDNITHNKRIRTLLENNHGGNVRGNLHVTGGQAFGVDDDGRVNYLVCAAVGEIPGSVSVEIPMSLIDSTGHYTDESDDTPAIGTTTPQITISSGEILPDGSEEVVESTNNPAAEPEVPIRILSSVPDVSEVPIKILSDDSAHERTQAGEALRIQVGQSRIAPSSQSPLSAMSHAGTPTKLETESAASPDQSPTHETVPNEPAIQVGNVRIKMPNAKEWQRFREAVTPERARKKLGIAEGKPLNKLLDLGSTGRVALRYPTFASAGIIVNPRGSNFMYGQIFFALPPGITDDPAGEKELRKQMSSFLRNYLDYNRTDYRKENEEKGPIRIKFGNGDAESLEIYTCVAGTHDKAVLITYDRSLRLDSETLEDDMTTFLRAHANLVYLLQNGLRWKPTNQPLEYEFSFDIPDEKGAPTST